MLSQISFLSFSFQCCVPEPKTITWSESFEHQCCDQPVKAVQFPRCSNSAFLSCLEKSVCQFIFLLLSAKHIYTGLTWLNISRKIPEQSGDQLEKTGQARKLLPQSTHFHFSLNEEANQQTLIL